MSDAHSQTETSGGNLRTPAAEQVYTRRWVIGLVAGNLGLGFLAAAWMFSVAGELPDPLASHWGRDGVDGYMSLAGHALIVVLVGGGSGALITALGVLARGQSPLMARLGVGFGLGFGVLMTGLSVAVVAGQIGLADSSRAEISAPVIWTAAGVAVLAAAAGAWLYRPGTYERTQSPETSALDDAAADRGSAVSLAARELAADEQPLAVSVSMGRWKWAASLGTGAAVALSLVFIHPALALCGVPAAALLWVFCQGRVIIDPNGVRALAGGFWKLMPLTYGEIRAASVQDIKAMDFGGWGYRLNGGSVGFIMGSGPALILEAGFAQRYVFSMPDAETAARACALVNAYRTKESDRGAGTVSGSRKQP
ncbi:hypothetical protein H9639_10090 [Arthrobacter sp. Sa2CUA1]|uniref:DUF1648 domain-containing protein n=1 Tax=Arthrobacter gallicola TaxID=2762225 RepID=A0ABR8UTU0_9MICC|nr:hypothetical protein [Arthrobacter gallicola]MBD7995646.1 hypothetical protein [Arthrobacter gallicola]